MKLAAATLAFLSLAASAAAKPSDFDRAFATHGRIAFAAGKGYSEASDVAIDGAGRIVLAGASQGGLGSGWAPGPSVARLTGAGRLDRRFGAAGRTALPTPGHENVFYRSADSRVALLPDGGMVVAATLRSAVAPAQVIVQRLRADGASVWTSLLAPAGEPWFLAGLGLDRDGRIVVAATRADGPVLSGVVVRLSPDGRVDPAFPRVTLPAGVWAAALLVKPDGSAFVAGHRAAVNGRRAREYVYSLDADGHARLTARFDLLDRADLEEARTTALARGPRGTLLIAGNDVHGSHDFGWLRRLRADGTADRAFAVHGRRRFGELVNDLARDRRGRIVLVGARYGRYLPHASVTRLTPGGRADRRFGRRGVKVLQLGARPHTHLIASQVRAVAIDARGRIVLAGVAYDDNLESREDLGRSYFAVARLKG